jgi:hypothetical protein
VGLVAGRQPVGQLQAVTITANLPKFQQRYTKYSTPLQKVQIFLLIFYSKKCYNFGDIFTEVHVPCPTVICRYGKENNFKSMKKVEMWCGDALVPNDLDC